MQIRIYVREEDLEELHHFLSSDFKYEHRIVFYSTDQLLSFPTYQVSLFYDDFVSLRDFQMVSTEHPYYPKESRTKEH